MDRIVLPVLIYLAANCSAWAATAPWATERDADFTINDLGRKGLIRNQRCENCCHRQDRQCPHACIITCCAPVM